MAFFRSFQRSIPSVSSILDSVTNVVDDLAVAVGDATYTVSDHLTEQVTNIMSKVQADQDEEVDQVGESAPSCNKLKHQDLPSKLHHSGSQVEDDIKTSTWDDHPHCDVRKSRMRLQQAETSGTGNSKTEKNDQPKKVRKEEDEEGSLHILKSKFQKPRGDSQSNVGSEGKASTSECQDHGDKSLTRKAVDFPNRCDRDAWMEGPANEICNSTSRARHSSPTSTCCKDKLRSSTNCDSVEESSSFLMETTSELKQMDNSSEVTRSHKSAVKDKMPKHNGKNQSGSPMESSGRSGEVMEKGRGRENSARDSRGSSSDSEDDGIGKRLESTQQQAGSWRQQGCSWNTRQKYSSLSAELEGYSSEASAGEANCVQRMRRTPPLDELQPPPYQDENGSPRMSPMPSDMGDSKHSYLMGGGRTAGRGRTKSFSDGSGDQETESYLTKGYEEDVPSDSTAVVGAEDVSARGSALQFPIGYEPEPLAKYGTLDVAFDYDSREQRLAVTVTAATDIPALKSMGNVAWQVHLVLLPTKKQRAKTGIQKGPCPVFTETFRFSPVEQDAIGSYAVRFRLYSVRRMKKEKILGEKVFYLTKLNLQGKMTLPVTLDPGCALTQGCGSLVSVTRSEGTSSFRSAGRGSTAEILVGLIYSAATGRLSVEVIKGSYFKNMAADKPPNTYVKLTMLNSMGQQMSKCKTSVSRGQPDPTYQETFVFQVALFQLSEVTLVLSVHCKRNGMRRKERLGWVSLGLNSSGEEELSHWTQMKETEGQQVCRWHSLLES